MSLKTILKLKGKAHRALECIEAAIELWDAQDADECSDCGKCPLSKDVKVEDYTLCDLLKLADGAINTASV